MRVSAVVVAGGRGERFGGYKQFEDLKGRSLASRSVARARCVAQHVILVVPEGYNGDGEGADETVVGGPTRSASVRCGLRLVRDADIVVVHDAARPLASEALFQSVVAAVASGASGAVPALQVTDTVKRVRRGSLVEILDTVPRDDLVTVQTPQAFNFAQLCRAHEGAPDTTDDAALLETLGLRVVAVPGERTNLKVTEPKDLVLLNVLDAVAP